MRRGAVAAALVLAVGAAAAAQGVRPGANVQGGGRVVAAEGGASGDAVLGIGAATETPGRTAIHFTTPGAKTKILAGLEHEGQRIQVLKGRWRTFAIDESKLPADAMARRKWARDYGMVRMSRSGAEVPVNAAELGSAPWRYGPALKLWFDTGGVVMTKGPGVYEIASGRFLPGLKLAKDGASLVPMHLGDKVLYVGHEGFLSTIGWGATVLPPAAVATGVYVAVGDE